MSEPDVAKMLIWLSVNADVLPEVREGWTGADITRRTKDEIHECIRCGDRARVAYVAEPIRPVGCRWLDLCFPCSYAVRKALETLDDVAAAE